MRRESKSHIKKNHKEEGWSCIGAEFLYTIEARLVLIQTSL